MEVTSPNDELLGWKRGDGDGAQHIRAVESHLPMEITD